MSKLFPNIRMKVQFRQNLFAGLEHCFLSTFFHSSGLRRRRAVTAMILLFFAAGFFRTFAADKMPPVTLDKLEGGSCRLPEDHAGSIILIEFWGTCCRAKLSHLKYLDELFKQYMDQGLIVYGINVDDASAKSRIRPAVKRYGYEFPVLLDPDREVLRKFNPSRVVPHTLLIGRDGEILFSAPGDKTVNRSQVEQLLKNQL
jgi:cytochrome c biogenesis protein CcmG, thiol:disulfide interchange protein DsbE